MGQNGRTQTEQLDLGEDRGVDDVLRLIHCRRNIYHKEWPVQLSSSELPSCNDGSHIICKTKKSLKFGTKESQCARAVGLIS